MRPTVHDIARLAGVSLATVDRVLNDRPGVRPQTAAKVRRAVEESGFRRDRAAANLAKQRDSRFYFLVPDSQTGFMDELAAALAEAAIPAADDRIRIEHHPVPAFDPGAIAHAIDMLDPRHCHGIALMAPGDPLVIAATTQARARGIKIVTLIADLPVEARDHFVGIDHRAAGRTAGALMARFLPPSMNTEDDGLIIPLMATPDARDHTQRLAGFAAILAEARPNLRLAEPLLGRDQADDNKRLVTMALENTPDLAGLYSIGAGNRGVLAALQTRVARTRPVVLAHELTPTSRQALHEGHFDAVINQNAGHHVRSAIRVLRALLGDQDLVASQEALRIEIFIQENLP